jgi:hypothetical protein
MRVALIVIVCVVALIGAVYATFRHVDRTQAQPARDLSKMMSVRLIVSEALSSHYQQHGSYPHSLSELPLQTLRWGHEGSSARDVEGWSYVSDGSSFTMTWSNARATELYVGGSTGQVYYSRDERR